MRCRISSSRRAFTLMEMMIAVAILVVVILGVALVFKSTARAVGMSQAALEMFSNVRVFEHQLEKDVQGADRDGFLVIRGKLVNGHRYDQLCFLAYGNFPNRTGATGNSPFADQTSANAAVVWYGHGIVAAGTDPGGAQNSALPRDAVPEGKTDSAFWLCRHTRLLMPPVSPDNTVRMTTGSYASAYPSAFWEAPQLSASALEPAAHITSSRMAPVSLAPSQLMALVTAGRQHEPRFEADHLCFRFKVLPNVYASEVMDANGRPSVVNAAFRMHPIFLQGTPDFAVEWTDGSLDAAGGLHWYGVGAPKYLRAGGQEIEPGLAYGDDYTAIFTAANSLQWSATEVYNAGDFVTQGGIRFCAVRSNNGRLPTLNAGDWVPVAAPEWPRALKFTYRVTDANDRLEGGRVFVRIVSLN